jgi:thiamine biosynthesis lipoprotein
MGSAAASAERRPRRRVLVPPVAGPLMRPPPGPIRTLSGDTMGTSWSVKLAGRPDLPLAMIEAAIRSALDGVIAEMSGWYPGSDHVRFNTAAAGTWHELPDGFRIVMEAAFRIAELSDGAFDPTLGAVVDLWGFGPSDASRALPDRQTLDGARAVAGWRQARLDGKRLLQPGGLALDLSGIAKGYAVDLVAAALKQLGLSSFLVEIGGELRGEGVKPDLSPWWVALERPPGASTDVGETLVALHGLSVATSGDYRRVRHVRGRRLSHTVDPATGSPVDNAIASVSVIHESCMEADAWATALTVLGPVEGMALARRHDIPAHLLVRAGGVFTELCTPALERLAE